MTRYALEMVRYDGADVQVLVEHPRPAGRPPAMFVPARQLGEILDFNPRNLARRSGRLGIVLHGGLGKNGRQSPLTSLPLHTIDEYLEGVAPNNSEHADRLSMWGLGLANAVSDAVLGGHSKPVMSEVDEDGDGNPDPIIARVPARVLDDVALDLAMALKPGLQAMISNLESKNVSLIAENQRLKRKIEQIEAVLRGD